MRDVIEVLKHIKKDEVTSRIVTNAYWGKSEKLARSVLQRLKDASLYEFNFSVDDFHQEHIPYETIKVATELAIEYGFPVLLAHKTYPGSKSSLETFEKLLGRKIPIFEDLSPAEKDEHKLCFSTGATIPVGRGAESIDSMSGCLAIKQSINGKAHVKRYCVTSQFNQMEMCPLAVV
uniref:Uncharacterized protein n=1 Tax=Candidatus Kentrum sp. SD TaxID=2126332 RepID=A0A451BN42_9GAMM|nr:MAG: hypothetical protein BECKSD772D_GA0070982_105818 [Candidatus Kentron sp. SD]